MVVLHRINYNMKGDDIKCTFMTMANHSINQVLVRTINTTCTSFIPVLAMLLFGGETLKDFAFAMAIGLLCGSYSSVAVATPLYAMWKSREPRYAKLAKKYGTEVGRFEFANPNAMATAAAAAKASKGASAAKAGKAPAGRSSKGASAANPASKAAVETTAAAKKGTASNGSAEPSAGTSPSSTVQPHGASASKAGSKPPKAKRKKRPNKK